LERAEQLRPVFDELAGLSARKIAAELNERKIVTPTGGVWHAATVIRVQKRLGAGLSFTEQNQQETHALHQRRAAVVTGECITADWSKSV
jgi:hypothetical protein